MGAFPGHCLPSRDREAREQQQLQEGEEKRKRYTEEREVLNLIAEEGK